jgi:hypothetical protein
VFRIPSIFMRHPTFLFDADLYPAFRFDAGPDQTVCSIVV